jgi:ech hydrogenase subunit F
MIFTMAKSVLKNFVRPAYTVKYPKVKKPFSDIFRGKISNDIEKCILCRICAIKCPTGALRVDKAAGEWEINPLACITCGYCVEVCPKKCLAMVNVYSSSVTAKADSIVLMVKQPPSIPPSPEKEPD